ncbi:MAG: coiled-coil domain-containing protein [Trebouxia sp. A1-2]|nr:MAG: coiled-coil domain-containing protein [Trebouxia sp. A1-2]
MFREQRIASRRSRIAEKIATLHAGEATGDDKAVSKEELGKGRQQVSDSQSRLLKLKTERDLDVSAVRVTGDERESQRRSKEEEERQVLRERLLTEAESSVQLNAEVASRWGHLFRLEVPQELHQEMLSQQAACDTIIASKDAIVAAMRSELHDKDDEYVRMLKQQGEDVDLLLLNMGKQLEDMQTAYRNELAQIDDAYMQERAEVVKSNRVEVEGLFDKRSSAEQAFLERYMAAAEAYERQLEDLRCADAEDYNLLKVRLETDIQTLEQHLESMRAAYQLNQEKLDYNYRVLLERDAENQATITQQKRKISKQRDLLSTLMQRYSQHEKKFAEANMRLTEEYKHITEHFKDLQAKFSHFQQADLNKYQAIWQMKQEEVHAVAHKLLAADRVIHEQQLGWQWQGPDEDALLAGPHSPQATRTLAGCMKKTSSQKAGKEEEQAAEEAVSQDEVTTRLQEPTYFGALQLLCDEAGFLVDSKAHKMLASLPKHQDEQLVHAESVVKALGVTDGASFDALMAALSVGEPEGTGSQSMGDPTLIHPADAVNRLRDFVEAENEQEQEYWQRLGNVVDDKLCRVYGAIEKNLQSYHQLLKDRASGLRQVEQMQQANQELRALLNQYLASPVNKELQIPPTQVL